MDSIKLDVLASLIKQAWEDDYPPEINVKGRKAWRKAHLVNLICEAFPSVDLSDFRKGAWSDEA